MRPLLSALLFVSLALPARTQQATDAPPDILQIYVDAVKPGKMAEYNKIENEAAAACARASTWPYLAMETLANAATARMSGVLSAPLRLAFRATSES